MCLWSTKEEPHTLRAPGRVGRGRGGSAADRIVLRDSTPMPGSASGCSRRLVRTTWSIRDGTAPKARRVLSVAYRRHWQGSSGFGRGLWGPGTLRLGLGVAGIAKGERTYLFLALGRAWYPACELAWHCPALPRASRARRAGAQRQGARGRGGVACHMVRPTRMQAAGPGDRITDLGAWRPHWLLAPTPLHWPLLSPSMTHRSPRVPPSLFHFPLRNVTLPFTSRPFASRQGVRRKEPKG